VADHSILFAGLNMLQIFKNINNFIIMTSRLAIDVIIIRVLPKNDLGVTKIFP